MAGIFTNGVGPVAGGTGGETDFISQEIDFNLESGEETLNIQLEDGGDVLDMTITDD